VFQKFEIKIWRASLTFKLKYSSTSITMSLREFCFLITLQLGWPVVTWNSPYFCLWRKIMFPSFGIFKKEGTLKTKREANGIVRSKFYIHLIVFPYEFSQFTFPCSENVLFASLYFFYSSRLKGRDSSFRILSWRLVIGPAFVNCSVSSLRQELTHAEAREELIIMMGSTRNISGGSESRLGAAISTRVPRIVFTVETAKVVRTDEDHNSQVKSWGRIYRFYNDISWSTRCSSSFFLK
jgi:hypothetical protein